jgi:hypothetical protein
LWNNSDLYIFSSLGQGTAYVCEAKAPAQVCKEDTPLTFQNILTCTRLNGKKNEKYSFATFTGDGVSYSSSIVTGAYTKDAYGPAF